MKTDWSGRITELDDPAPHYPPTDPAQWWLPAQRIAPRPEPRVVGTDPLCADLQVGGPGRWNDLERGKWRAMSITGRRLG